MSPTISGGGSAAAASTLAGFEVGYDAVAAPVSVISTTEAAGTTVITCAAHTFDGSPVLATFFTPFATTDATINHQLVVCLFEGAVEIGRFTNLNTPAASGMTAGLTAMLRFTPSAASHTYTVTAFMTAGTGTVGAGAGGTGANVAAFVRFTKV